MNGSSTNPDGRHWMTRNPWTGQPEEYVVWIDDEALRDWELDRVRLHEAGYPDRPPERVRDYVRVWSADKPGQPIAPGEFVGCVPKLGADRRAIFLGMLMTGDGDPGVKVNVGRRGSVYVLHLVVADARERVERVAEADDAASVDALLDAIERGIVAPLGLEPLTWRSVEDLSGDLLDGNGPTSA